MRAKVFDLQAEREVEDDLRRAAVELLGKHQERLFGPSLPVGRTPNRNIQGFLFDLIGYDQPAKKSASCARQDIERRAVAVGLEARVRRNELKHKRHRFLKGFVLAEDFSIREANSGSQGKLKDSPCISERT